MEKEGLDRRMLLKRGGLGVAGAVLSAAAAQGQAVPQVDRGKAQGARVAFPSEDAETEAPAGMPPNPDAPGKRVGFAIVGLGRLSVEQILPAFGSAKHCRPTALVSGDPAKAKALAAQYGISRVLGYEQMEQLKDDPETEVVYIVLPNALHREYTERAAKIGKHVLCEKPMTVSVEDAEAMIAACETAKVQLMVAYRIQYEPYNRLLGEMVRGGKLGTVRAIQAVNTQNIGDPKQWRCVRKLSGGGSLPDIGLYDLNTVRALLGEEPVEITARVHSPEGDPRFRELEDLVQFTMRFPSGVVAVCTSSYSTHELRQYEVLGTEAWARMDNAFSYHGQRLTVQRREGKGTVAGEYSLAPKDQFALEMDHFAECVRTGRKPRTGGAEGLQDQKLMAAIYRAAETGVPVSLPPTQGLDATRGPALADEG